jgi:hypothetical protein
MAPNSGGTPRLSIVIPATQVAALEDTLVSVLENRPDDCEIIVALAVPYADPWSIGEEVRFVPAPVGAGLIDCVNLGVASSAGEIVHVLAAGWRATEGWAEAALARFAEDDVAAVVPLTVAADDRGRVVAAGIRRTRGGRSVTNTPARGGRQVEGLTVGDMPAASAPTIEAGFWRVESLPRRGFTKACGERLAAADMAATIAAAGERAVIEPACRVAEGSKQRSGSPYRDGLHAERLFWRSLAGEAVLPSLLAHALEVVRHSVATAPTGTLPMLAGRLTALVQFGSCLSRARELNAVQAKAGARRRGATEESGGATLRIDAGHALPSRPRRAGTKPAAATGQEPPLRRSA